MRTPFSNFSFWSLVWDLRRALFSEPLETWKRHGRTPYSRAIWGHGICTPDIVDLISEMSNIIDILQRKVGILTHKAIGMPDIRSGSTVKKRHENAMFFLEPRTLLHQVQHGFILSQSLLLQTSHLSQFPPTPRLPLALMSADEWIGN